MPDRFEGATSPLELLLPTIEPRDELPEPAPARRVTISIDLSIESFTDLEALPWRRLACPAICPCAGPLDRARSLQLPLEDAEGVAFDAAPVILQQPAEVQTMSPTRGWKIVTRSSWSPTASATARARGQSWRIRSNTTAEKRSPRPGPTGRDDRRRGPSVRETQAEGVPPVRDSIPGRLQDDEPGLRASASTIERLSISSSAGSLGSS